MARTKELIKLGKKERTFLDKNGFVVTADNPNVEIVRETEWDDDGKLLRSAVYFRDKGESQ